MIRLKKMVLSTFVLCLFFVLSLEAAQKPYYPNQDWKTLSAQSQALDQERVDALFKTIFKDQATQAVVLIKNGYIVKERYAEGFDKDAYSTSWSVAKSFYASLLGVLIEQKKLSFSDLNKPLNQYIKITTGSFSSPRVYDLLSMSSGFHQNKNEHEEMFFNNNQLSYAQKIPVDKEPNTVFEYNNVNSMRLGELIETLSNEKAREFLISEVLEPIGINDYRLWKDPSGASLSYCCIDMSPRHYARFGLLFAREGKWEAQQLINQAFVKEGFKHIWGDFPRAYGLHWWIAAPDLFYASGRFGQAIFVSPKHDLVLVKTTKYIVPKAWENHMYLGFLSKLSFLPLEWRIKIALLYFKLNPKTNIKAPFTTQEGTSTLWYKDFGDIVKQIKQLDKK